MERTKHDLSADIVKIDYDALRITAAIAVDHARTAVENKLTEVQNSFRLDNPTHHLEFASRYLASAANDLAQVAETYNALTAGVTRKTKKLINVPEIIDSLE